MDCPDSDDRQHLVEKNDALARTVALKFLAQFTSHRSRLGRDDILQEARLAMLVAARTFDPGRGYAFSTYAYRVITNRLRNYLGDAGPIRVPPNSIKSAATPAIREAALRAMRLRHVGDDSYRLRRTADAERLDTREERRREWLAVALTKLGPRAQRILRETFGLDGREPRGPGEIAADMGCARSTVRVKRSEVMGWLRDQAAAEGLA